MKKILFISHDASRTGAPLVLLDFIKELSLKKDLKLKVLFVSGGELLEDFEKLCDIEVLRRNKSFIFKLIRKVTNYNSIIKRINKENFDLLYVNSIASFVYFPEIHLLNTSKTILHFHESKNFTTYTSFNLLKKAIERSDKIICVSNLVKQHLLSLIEIDAQKLCVFYPIQKIVNNSLNEFHDIEIPENAFVVGGCGNYNIIKGLDIFLIVAKNVIKQEKDRPVYFIWLGDMGRNEMKYIIDNDVEKLGLKDRVKILSKIKNPETIFSKFDLFFLSAREEAFGLAAFENGLLGKPIVYFKGASGVAELIDKDSGIAVDYLDIIQAAQSILELYESPEILTFKKNAIKNSFIEEFYKDRNSKTEYIIRQLIS